MYFINSTVCLNLICVCPQGRPMSLDQCLQHFISSETIKEVECENCTKVRSAQHQSHATILVIISKCVTRGKQTIDRKLT